MINLRPNNLKHSKLHINYLGNKNKKGINITYGYFGLKAIENGRIFPEQIETIRRLISGKIKTEGFFFINIFPNNSLTLKAIGSRMGSGKGNVEKWYASIHTGQILFELSNISFKIALKLLKQVKVYLPIKTKIVFFKKYN